MNEVPRLDQLHDIVVPPRVAWWPPAPGWYVVLVIAFCVAGWLLARGGLRWRRNAYRRAAMKALMSADSPAAISEVLRRTALAIAPRPVVANQTGDAWPQWLSEHCAQPLPEAARRQLAGDVYNPKQTSTDL